MRESGSGSIDGEGMERPGGPYLDERLVKTTSVLGKERHLSQVSQTSVTGRSPGHTLPHNGRRQRGLGRRVHVHTLEERCGRTHRSPKEIPRSSGFCSTHPSSTSFSSYKVGPVRVTECRH